jgi:steroid delta-isomerase-like uncharacterized protein
MIELLRKHLAAVQASDFDAVEADLAPGFEFEGVAIGRRGHRDEYLAQARKWMAAYPDLKATITSYYEAGDRIIAEIEWAGTNRGAIDLHSVRVPATNKAARVKGVMIYRIKDGKLVEMHNYFDLLGLLKQIGALPAVGATPEKAAEKRVVH